MSITKTELGSRPTIPAQRGRTPKPARRGRRQARIGIVAGDLVVLSAAVVFAWNLRAELGFWLRPSESAMSLASSAGPQIVLAWLAVLFYRGAYSAKVFGAGTDEYRRVLTASLATAGLVGMYCYLVSVDLSRGFVFLAFTIGVPTLLLWRWVARQLIRRARAQGRLIHQVIVVGGPAGVGEVLDVLRREDHLGYKVIGACLPSGARPAPTLGVPVVGTVGTIRQVCAAMQADTVLVTQGGYESSEDLRKIAWDLQGSDVDLIVVPSLTDVAGPRIHMRPVAGLPLLHLTEPQVDEAGGLSKRLFDFVGSAAAIVLLSPILAVVALLIKAEDGGPVLFKQRRVGWNGDEFLCFKFRSMVTDADRLERALREADGHEGALWKQKTDPRVTRIGRFIRRYSLDELPQFFNVFSGKMSLVGPRPQQGWEVETYNDSTKRRLLVRPGMTGLWQVSGRSDLSLEEAMRLDLYYVDNWSLATDIVIMGKTVKAVLGGSGAY